MLKFLVSCILGSSPPFPDTDLLETLTWLKQEADGEIWHCLLKCWCCENKSSLVFKHQPGANKMVPPRETSMSQ